MNQFEEESESTIDSDQPSRAELEQALIDEDDSNRENSSSL